MFDYALEYFGAQRKPRKAIKIPFYEDAKYLIVKCLKNKSQLAISRILPILHIFDSPVGFYSTGKHRRAIKKLENNTKILYNLARKFVHYEIIKLSPSLPRDPKNIHFYCDYSIIQSSEITDYKVCYSFLKLPHVCRCYSVQTLDAF